MAVKTSNEQLQDALIRHQTYLLRYSGMVRNRIWDILNATEQDLVDRIRIRLANNKGLTTPVELKRLQSLTDQIATIRMKAWDEVDFILREELVALALHEPVAIDESLKITLPVKIVTALPTTRLLRAIATDRPFQGYVLQEWVQAMAVDDLRRINSAVQLGMTAGEDMDTIARRVTGAPVFGGRDGQTELSRRQVQAITRTAVMHVANTARTNYFIENSDVITQEYFVATLDSRTTPICRSLDGEKFNIGEGPVPPLHFQCRSLRIASIDGTLLGSRPAKPFVESELVQEYARNNRLGQIRRRSDLPRGTKGAFDKWRAGRIRQLIGPIPASVTYQEWLKRQSRTFQDDILGVTKARLFRDGGLTLDKFVNRNGDELTLHQLAIKEKEAFKAAGLNPEDF